MLATPSEAIEVIPAFFIDRDARYTLLFSHGNAEDLGSLESNESPLPQNGYVNWMIHAIIVLHWFAILF